MPGFAAQPVEKYPNVHYAANAVITSLSDSTHFDLGGYTLAATQRAVFPYAGTGTAGVDYFVGVYVRNSANDAWTLDPHFVAIEGYSVEATRSAKTFRQTAATGAATPVFVACPPLGDAIVSPRIPPNYESLTSLALSTNNVTSFPAITFPTLDASRNYNFQAYVEALLTVDSDTTGQAKVKLWANVTIVTDSSGVSTCTVDPAPTVNTDLVPTALLGVTIGLVASTGGVTVTATRKSGVAMHADYELHIQRFRDVGAASSILLPSDIPGLLWWYKSGALITISGSNLVTWGDSSGNGCTGTVYTDSGKTPAQYSATGGAGLAGARIILAAGHPNSLNLPSNWLNLHDPAVTAMQVFHIMKLAADPPNLGGQGGLCKLGGGAGGALVPLLGSATIYDDTASNTQTNTGVGTGGLADAVCCFSSIGAAGRRATRFNGAELWTSASNTVAHDNSPRLWVIGDDPHTYYTVGEYYECFAFDHELSVGDLAKIDGYLMTGKQGQGGFGVHA